MRRLSASTLLRPPTLAINSWTDILYTANAAYLAIGTKDNIELGQGLEFGALHTRDQLLRLRSSLCYGVYVDLHRLNFAFHSSRYSFL